jgi:hypothetical protein
VRLVLQIRELVLAPLLQHLQHLDNNQLVVEQVVVVLVVLVLVVKEEDKSHQLPKR